jgi:hypothetical protein
MGVAHESTRTSSSGNRPRGQHRRKPTGDAATRPPSVTLAPVDKRVSVHADRGPSPWTTDRRLAVCATSSVEGSSLRPGRGSTPPKNKQRVGLLSRCSLRCGARPATPFPAASTALPAKCMSNAQSPAGELARVSDHRVRGGRWPAPGATASHSPVYDSKCEVDDRDGDRPNGRELARRHGPLRPDPLSPLSVRKPP